jgi:hypothetical protein
MTPDFPSAARAIEASYETAIGHQLAGVITADPFLLASLVHATGPVTVPGADVTLESKDVVPFLSNDGYGVIMDPTARKRILGGVAQVVLGRALATPDADVLRALLSSAGDTHLKVYSDDRTLERALEVTGAGAAFTVGDGDFLGVVQNNASADKLDYYTTREVRYEIWLDPGGAAHATTEVTLHNGTPLTHLPERVLGEGNPDRDLPRGAVRSLVNVYCRACALQRASADGEPVTVSGGTELGATFFQRDLTLPRGATDALRLSWVAPSVWQGDGSGGTYELAVHTQTTIRPTHLSVRIHPPGGMHPTALSEGMRVVDGVVVWDGTAPARLDLELRFAPAFPLAVWRAVTSVFD